VLIDEQDARHASMRKSDWPRDTQGSDNQGLSHADPPDLSGAEKLIRLPSMHSSGPKVAGARQ
jgi:hypothetical protein